MYKIEATVTTANPKELKLSANCPLAWLQALGPTALGSTEIERQLAPGELFEPLYKPIQPMELLGNRGNWPNLQLAFRTFPGI